MMRLGGSGTVSRTAFRKLQTNAKQNSIHTKHIHMCCFSTTVHGDLISLSGRTSAYVLLHALSARHQRVQFHSHIVTSIVNKTKPEFYCCSFPLVNATKQAWERSRRCSHLWWSGPPCLPVPHKPGASEQEAPPSHCWVQLVLACPRPHGSFPRLEPATSTQMRLVAELLLARAVPPVEERAGLWAACGHRWLSGPESVVSGPKAAVGEACIGAGVRSAFRISLCWRVTRPSCWQHKCVIALPA